MSPVIRKTGPLIAAFIVMLVWLSQAAGQSQAQRQTEKPQPAPELVLQTGHSGAIKAIAFSPDGQTVLSASDDQTVIVWDVQTGEIRRRLEGHPGAVFKLVFSHDGKTLATLSDGGSDCGTGDFSSVMVTLWDVGTWKKRRTIFTGYTSNCGASPSFSPDLNKLVLDPCSDAVWDLSTGQWERLKELSALSETISHFSFAGDKAIIGLIRKENNESYMQWWNRSSYQPTQTQRLQGFFEEVSDYVFSPGGDTLAVTLLRNGTIQIWKTQTGKYQRTLAGSESASRLQFIRGGKTIKAFTKDGELKLWDVMTGKLIKSLSISESNATFSPDLKFVAVSTGETTITLLDFATGKALRKLAGQGAPAKINTEGKMSLWFAPGAELSKDGIINSVRFSPDGKFIAHGSGDTVRLWDAGTMELSATLSGHSDEVTALDFAPDGKTIASSSLDESVKLWNVETVKLKRTLTGVGNADRLGVFISNGALPFKLDEDEKTLAVRQDGKLMAGYHQYEIKLRELPSGKIIRSLTDLPDGVTSVAFSADSKYLAIGSYCNEVFVVSAQTGKARSKFQLDEKVMDYVNSVVFSPDGKTIAAGTNYGKVTLLDAETGKLKHSTIGHANLVASVTFSPDGRILATGGYDRTVKLWEAANGRLLVTLMILPAVKAGQVAAEWIAFTPQGYYSGSPGAARFVRWRVGDKLLPAVSHSSTFNRPDLIQQVMR